jgi:hypothetical protein
MSLFDDNKFNQFDDLTQLIVPFVSKANELLKDMPDVTAVTSSIIRDVIPNTLRIGGHSYNTVTASRIVEYSYGHIFSLAEQTIVGRSAFREAFKFKIDGEPIFDYVNNTISGGCVDIVKSFTHYSEERIIGFMENTMDRMYFSRRRNRYSGGAADIAKRMREVLSIFDAQQEIQELKGKGLNEANHFLHRFLQRAMKERLFLIRDAELFLRLTSWIREYVMAGSEAGLRNICLYQVMAADGNPIYSISGLATVPAEEAL